jgi:hypothetical protein
MNIHEAIQDHKNFEATLDCFRRQIQQEKAKERIDAAFDEIDRHEERILDLVTIIRREMTNL